MIPKWIYLLMVEDRARTRFMRMPERKDDNLETRTEDAPAVELASPGYMERQQESTQYQKPYQK